MWKELLAVEQRKLEEAQKEFDYQLNVVWKNANTITQRQNAEKRRAELKEIINLAKINIETYRLTAVKAGEIEPKDEVVEEIKITPVIKKVVKEPEMTPQEAMQILMSFTNSNLISEEVEEDDAHDEKDDI